MVRRAMDARYWIRSRLTLGRALHAIFPVVPDMKLNDGCLFIRHRAARSRAGKSRAFPRSASRTRARPYPDNGCPVILRGLSGKPSRRCRALSYFGHNVRL